MSDVTIIRYQVRPEAAEDNRRLVEAVMAELADQDPGGLRYAAFRLADKVTFVHLVVTESGGRSPLADSPAFAAFQQDFAGRQVPGTLTRDTAAALGSYGFLPLGG
jgi:hypothetical protein